jgi:heme/copper-type cytochrome/quinol oxidase subunit 1
VKRHLPGVIAAVAFALVLGGVVVFEVGERSGSALDFGWTAYAPLPPDAYRSQVTLSFDDGWAVLWGGAQVLGGLLVVVGLLVLTAVGSWLTGRRSAAPR